MTSPNLPPSPAATTQTSVPPGTATNLPGRLPKLRDFLRIMVKESASDLVLKANGCPAVRVAGVIRFLGDQPLPPELVRSYVDEVLPLLCPTGLPVFLSKAASRPLLPPTDRMRRSPSSSGAAE